MQINKSLLHNAHKFLTYQEALKPYILINDHDFGFLGGGGGGGGC